MRTWKLPKLDLPSILSSLLILFILVFTVILSLKNSFIADDFIQYPAKDIITEHIYLRDSGRISHGLVMQFLYGIFDSKAVNILPIIIVVLLFGALMHMGYTLTKKLRESLWISGLLGTAFLAAMPSYFDFSLFFSAACVHSISFIVLILVSSLIIDRYITHARDRTYVQLAIIYGLSVFLALLSELSSILMCGILLTIGLYIKNYKSIVKLLPLLAIQLSGFLIIYTSPGSTGRRADASAGQSILEILHGALVDFLHTSQLTMTNALFIVSSLLTAVILAKYITTKKSLPYILFGSLFILIPFVITATTNFSLGYTSLRMFNLGTFSVLCLMIILWLLLLRFKTISTMADRLLPYLKATLPVILAAIFLINNFIPINSALESRSQQLKERESLIESSRKLGTIDFLPAPLLLSNTEAIDIGFYPEESPNSRWLYSALLGYYGIRDFEINLLEQPDQYCINVDIYNRFKEIDAKKCGTY